MKVVTVIGARPQFIKAAMVSRIIRKNTWIKEILVHTGQHYDTNLSDVFFAELEMAPPDCNLGVGSASQGAQTGRMLEAVERVVLKETPDWVLVYGDTNSTLAGALAAAKLHVPVAHVEAGLRSHNRSMPEEINRILADHVSNLLFAPTAAAVKNLAAEGITGSMVRHVGDVMYDAMLFYTTRARDEDRVLEELGVERKQYALATIHRAENTEDPTRLEGIFSALVRVADRLPVVLPLHPRTAAALQKHGLLKYVESKLRAIEPMGFTPMLEVEKHARLIITDSGGVQKEAFFHRVPCVTLREETEWVELVEYGYNRLAGADRHRILSEVEALLAASELNWERSLYGWGHAAEEIVDVLRDK